MKTAKLKISLITVFLLLSLSLLATKEYIGTVVPLATEKLAATSNAYDRGWIIYTAKLGQIVAPPYYNSKGDIVVPGSTLVFGDPSAWTPYLKADKIQLMAAKKKQQLGKSVFERYKKMAEEKAVSQQNFTDAKSALARTTGQYLNYITVLKQGEIAAKRFNIDAPFEGIVTAVTQGSGSDVGNAPAVEVVQLNPIGIELQVPLADQLKINKSTKAKIYVKGIDKPFGAIHTTALINNKSVIIGTKNFPVIEKNQILKENGTPVLREWLPVVGFELATAAPKTLAVSTKAIQNDEKGKYVLRAKGQKVMQSDKGIDYTFQIEKVYVKPGKLTRYYTSYAKIQNLEDAGGLELNDLVLNSPPKDLKDGEKVIYPQQAYLFMPGDKVKVVVDFADNES